MQGAARLPALTGVWGLGRLALHQTASPTVACRAGRHVVGAQAPARWSGQGTEGAEGPVRTGGNNAGVGGIRTTRETGR